MNAITITRSGVTLASHTADHARSSYGTLIWSIEESNPDPGPAEWSQQDNGKMAIKIIGVVGGWLVAIQPNGLLVGILWSDGSYYAECIVNRQTQTTTSRAKLSSLQSGKYMVRGTIVPPDDKDAVLGSILM